MTETKRPVLVYLTEQERQALQAKADEDGRSLSAMARWLLRRAMGF